MLEQVSNEAEPPLNEATRFTFLFQDEPFLLIDVRTPSEFQKGHIPGAVNVPLFLDEERAAVGLLYKQKGSRAAVRAGLDYVGPRLSALVKQVEDLLEKGKNTQRLILYCWRGGMRSASVAWLLRLYGMEPETIPGGYKSFRRFVGSLFTRPIPLAVLGGLTGSGKTEVLRYMRSAGIPVVDLEELACHQGSAFGHLGQATQPSQEQFENLLASALYRAAKKASMTRGVVWLEDESRFIGSLHLPLPLWQRMQEAPLYLMPDKREYRLNTLITNYGHYDPGALAASILKIRKKLGPERTAQALAELGKGNLRNTATILLEYYDKTYTFSLTHKRGPAPVCLPPECLDAEKAARYLASVKPLNLAATSPGPLISPREYVAPSHPI